MNTKTFLNLNKIITGMGTNLQITSNDNYIFIVGFDRYQVLNISSLEIIHTSNKLMNIYRTNYATVVHPITNELYVIGGLDIDAITYLSSIEKINVTNVTSDIYNWVNNTYDLIYTVAFSYALVYQNYILISSGIDASNLNTDVQIINVINGMVSLGLNYTLNGYAANIIVNNIFYSFGGLSTIIEDTWIYAQLLSFK